MVTNKTTDSEYEEVKQALIDKYGYEEADFKEYDTTEKLKHRLEFEREGDEIEAKRFCVMYGIEYDSYIKVMSKS